VARASNNSTIMVAVNSNSRVRIKATKATTKAIPVVMEVVVLKEVAISKETREVSSKGTRASVLSTTVVKANIKTIVVVVVATKIPEEDVAVAVQVASPVHR